MQRIISIRMKYRHNLTNFFNGDTELVASLCNPQPRERGRERPQTAQEEKRTILLGALRKYIRRRRRPRPRRSRLPLASLGGLRSGGGGGGLGSALGTN